MDVGANIGQTLLDYISADTSSGYVGFEPNINCAVHLSRFISDNNLADCQLVPAALSDSDGVVALYLESAVDSMATTVKGFRPGRESKCELIACFRLDSLRSSMGLDEIAIIKIDVEGGELAAVSGMIETIEASQPWLLCEVLGRPVGTPAHANSEQFAQLVHKLGYQIMHIGKTEDRKNITSLTALESFRATKDNEPFLDIYDYLLVPRADETQARSAILS